MSSTEAPIKRKLDATEKTPISVLQELCAQENEPLMYEYVPHETNPNLFSCLVTAFDLVCSGSGQSKKEAKHGASEALMGWYCWSCDLSLDVIPIFNLPHRSVSFDYSSAGKDGSIQADASNSAKSTASHVRRWCNCSVAWYLLPAQFPAAKVWFSFALMPHWIEMF